MPSNILLKYFCFYMAICGVVIHDYLKIRDVQAVQPLVNSVSGRMAKVRSNDFQVLISEFAFFLLSLCSYSLFITSFLFLIFSKRNISM